MQSASRPLAQQRSHPWRALLPQRQLESAPCRYVAGRRRLYGYCREHGVTHARIGKLIVVTSEAEIPALEKIAVTARGNGVDDLEWLGSGASAAA
jgi:L-2-hydroxyglutarate oxidase LhgO